jgi:mono-ADP-ribosyltransferase sirtuin 6
MEEDGSQSGYVQLKRDCAHVEASVGFPPKQIDLKAACSSCAETENWICLACLSVGCGRFRNSHAKEHYEQTRHAIAISVSDLNVWCYECESYIAHPLVERVHDVCYLAKFGQKPKRAGHASEEEIKEYFDEPDVLKHKVAQLAELVKSNCTVIYTGAGVSTSAKIPDYRGPKGVWTLKDRGEAVKMDITLDQAEPTLAHMAMVSMMQHGKLAHVVSTNVDGLHRRSGLRADQLSELHGNAYREDCENCGKQWLRFYTVEGGVGHYTGRHCEECNGFLKDNIIHFGENLPQDELSKAFDHAGRSQLSLVLGTSMRVSPANRIPLEPLADGGSMVIVNLQKTPFDDRATLVIHARTDQVMEMLMQHLNLAIPKYNLEEDLVRKQ